METGNTRRGGERRLINEINCAKVKGVISLRTARKRSGPRRKGRQSRAIFLARLSIYLSTPYNRASAGSRSIRRDRHPRNTHSLARFCLASGTNARHEEDANSRREFSAARATETRVGSLGPARVGSSERIALLNVPSTLGFPRE